MCRNIRTLFNFEPPATELENRDAALQFVRKLRGCEQIRHDRSPRPKTPTARCKCAP